MSYEPKCIGSNASMHFGAELSHEEGVKQPTSEPFEFD
jgi:hypothetical protein